MSDTERITALEARLNEAEGKHNQTMASVLGVMHDVNELKSFRGHANQIFTEIATRASDPSAGPAHDALLKNYEIHSHQITTYLDLIGKASVWQLAVTAATVSYCVAHPGETIRLALTLPFLMCLGSILIYTIGLRGARNTHREIERLATALRLLTSPDARVLTMALWFNIGWLSVLAGGLAWLFFALPHLPAVKVPP